MRLLEDVVVHLLSKEVTAEYSNMESILHHARRAEENVQQISHWRNDQHIMRARDRALEELSDSRSESEVEDGEGPLPDAIPDPAGNK